MKIVRAAIGAALSLVPVLSLGASSAARELDHFSIFDDGVVVHAERRSSGHGPRRAPVMQTAMDVASSALDREPLDARFAMLSVHTVRHEGIAGGSTRSGHDVFEQERDLEWRASLLAEGTRVAWSTDQDDLAKRRAQALLELAPRLALDAAVDATHLAHTVLGQHALQSGAIGAAARHLSSSAKVVGSAALRSEGPSFELAQALLERGRRGAVLGYLRNVARFWQDDHGCLATWRSTLEAGDTPDFTEHRCVNARAR